jgi:hypothetical protein
MKSINITKILRESQNDLERISAQVNGERIWYECREGNLKPSAEAFASAFLFSAMKHRADIVLQDPISPIWLKNAERYMEVCNRWWDYKPIRIVAPIKDVSSITPAEKTSMLFSAGLDSFHTLLRAPYNIDQLVISHGFDISKTDYDTMENLLSVSRAVADSLSKELIVVRTNVFYSPINLKVPWQHSHGAILLSIAHLLDGIGRFIISSSFHYGQDFPWGSHWELDHLMSSDELEILHYNPSLSRSMKVKEMVQEPLVKKYLRVCFDRKNNWLNCSSCEKCIRTMIDIDAAGNLKDFESFSPERPLEEMLADMRYLVGYSMRFFRDIVDANPSYHLTPTIEDLLRRSANHYKNKKGVKRVIGKFKEKVLGVAPKP